MEEQNSERGGEECDRLVKAIAVAADLIDMAVEIMDADQVGKWTGVRAWLETYAPKQENGEVQP